MRLRGLFSLRRAEQELAAELESHLQMHVEDNLRLGMTPEQARREALLQLGGVEQVRQVCRDRSTIPSIESLLQDAKYAFSRFRKQPEFSRHHRAYPGVRNWRNDPIYSLVDGIILTPLPLPHSEQLVSAYTKKRVRGIPRVGLQPLSKLPRLA